MTPQTVQTLKELARGLLLAATAGAFLALSNAFTQGQPPLTLRLAYWIPLMITGGLWGHFCSLLACRWIDPAERPWLASAVMSAMIALPMTVVVWAVTGLVYDGRVYPLSWLPAFLLPVTIICAAMCVLNVFLARGRTIQTHAAAPGAAPARFLDRLPPRLRGARLIAVQAEDHYLRLHTDRGSDLILMRLSDAVAELEGLEGAQVHRSWWAAKGAVRDVSRGDGRAVLTLEGDLKVPVSRVHARRLRAEGWW
ncbi:MAG: LytTR family transcriptional regulator DNA-binding domain-containing protein [Caulobacterales bacterium]|nr:LytTR family transcriptional regulator DNA-binding domain-containing protein [Caulobacterales bacterium]